MACSFCWGSDDLFVSIFILRPALDYNCVGEGGKQFAGHCFQKAAAPLRGGARRDRALGGEA
ncbi:MAG: hypothetical protein M5U01_16590 [Ardenticatenaceae bacterium]|nr:hypothetical protein [Ardenticatenaceae bacterium]